MHAHQRHSARIPKRPIPIRTSKKKESVTTSHDIKGQSPNSHILVNWTVIALVSHFLDILHTLTLHTSYLIYRHWVLTSPVETSWQQRQPGLQTARYQPRNRPTPPTTAAITITRAHVHRTTMLLVRQESPARITAAGAKSSATILPRMFVLDHCLFCPSALSPS